MASLYELSKASADASSAAVDFYNASLAHNDDATLAFAELADSLKLLTRASQGISHTANDITTEAGLVGINADPALLTVGEPAKKKKVEKDPFAPKKPLTVFFAYSAYVREALRAERQAQGLPALSSTEITQVISLQWNDMSAEEKQKWKEAYAGELQIYQVEKEKYLEDKKNGLPPNNIPTHAPVPVPAYLEKKRPSEEKEKEKKKKKKSKKNKLDDGLPRDF